MAHEYIWGVGLEQLLALIPNNNELEENSIEA